MRTLAISYFISLDGVHEDPMAWVGPYYDQEAVGESVAELERAHAMLMGRNTYDYLKKTTSGQISPHAVRLNEIPKYVYSSTLSSVDWPGSTVISTDPMESVMNLKKDGNDELIIYGHGQLSHQLLQSGLVDEVRIGIFPLVLGRGRPAFSAARSPVAMKLVDMRKSQTGVVHLIYGK